MSKTTVRTILQVILENNLQMDDEIGFEFATESKYFWHTLALLRTETVSIEGQEIKSFNFIFEIE